MKSVLLIATGAAALTLAACDRNGAPVFGPAAALKPVSRLNCPDRQGELTRVSASPDGQACNYTDGRGSEVALQIVRTSGGDPRAALKPLEASLSQAANQPGPVDKAALDGDSDSADIGGEVQTPVAADNASRDAATRAAAEAGRDAAAPGHEDDVDRDADDHPGHRGEPDRVNVDMPGLHVKTDGDNAHVKILGIDIDATEDHGTVTHRPRSGVGRSFTVEGGDKGAVIRTENVGRANFRSTVMWVQDSDDGRKFQSVGYVAAGPKTGPLVVATVKTRTERKGIYEDAGKVVRRASRD